MRNVARTWAFETGILLGEPLDSQLPYNDYYEVSKTLCRVRLMLSRLLTDYSTLARIMN